MLLISLRLQLPFVSAFPKYLNFALFLNDLLTMFVLLIYAAWWSGDMTIYITWFFQHLFPDQTLC
jgi:hypothetical protein